MGVGPLTSDTSTARMGGEDAGNWRLDPKIDQDVQGIVVSGYAALSAATALFLKFDVSGGAWLKALREIVTITPADGPQQPAAMIAFTSAGLAELGLPTEVLGTFLLPFQEGMLQKDRSRRLRDVDDGVEASTSPDSKSSPHPIPPDPIWSGNGQEKKTQITVHALLILYEESRDALTNHVESVRTRLKEHDIKVVREISLDLNLDEQMLPHEHFGFADGISQPIPFGPGTTTKNGGEYPRDPLHGVPLGEILLGYENAHGETPPGPVVAGAARVGYDKQTTLGTEKLEPIHGSAGLLDLGRNGTYLVVRELKQDVAGFWNSMESEAQSLNDRAGTAQPVDVDWLAARVVGRTLDGALLCPSGPLPLSKNNLPNNNALFFRDDRHGFGCPLGSHVRRSNPRDGTRSRSSLMSRSLARSQ